MLVEVVMLTQKKNVSVRNAEFIDNVAKNRAQRYVHRVHGVIPFNRCIKKYAVHHWRIATNFPPNGLSPLSPNVDAFAKQFNAIKNLCNFHNFHCMY